MISQPHSKNTSHRVKSRKCVTKILSYCISAWDCTEKCPKPSWDKLQYYPFNSQAGQILFTKKSRLPLCSLRFLKIRNIKLIYHACILGLQFVTPRQQYILYSTLITGYENQVWMTLVTHGRTDCKLTAESFDLLSSCPYNSEEHKEYLYNFFSKLFKNLTQVV